MFVSDLFLIEKNVERCVQKRKPKVKRNDFCQNRKTSFYAIFDALKMNDCAVFMSLNVLGKCCGFPVAQWILPWGQILSYGVIKLRIVNDATHIRTISYFRDDCDFVCAGQERQFSDPFSSDKWSASG